MVRLILINYSLGALLFIIIVNDLSWFYIFDEYRWKISL